MVDSNHQYITELEDRNRSLEELIKKHKESENLHANLLQLSTVASTCATIDDFYVEAHKMIETALTADNIYIALYSDDRQSLDFVYMVDTFDRTRAGTSIPISEMNGSLTMYTLEKNEAVLVDGDELKEGYRTGKFIQYGPMGVEWIGIPLKVDGTTIGILAVQSYDEDKDIYQDAHRDILDFIGQHVVSVLTRLQVKQSLRQIVEERTQELNKEIEQRKDAELLQQVLYHISELTHRTDDMDMVYDELHKLVGQLMNAENFYIARLENDMVHFDYVSDQTHCGSVEPRNVHTAGGVTEHVIQTGDLVLLGRDDITQMIEDGKVSRLQDNIAWSWLGAPLQFNSSTYGVMVVQSYDESVTYDESHAELFAYISQHVSALLGRHEMQQYKQIAQDELERKVDERTRELKEANLTLQTTIRQNEIVELKLKHAANHDSLTGLPNRQHFTTELDRAIVNKMVNDDFQFAIMFIDLDRFKKINDSLGHHVGDFMLKEFSQRLQRILRDSDLVARLGGDEFAILLRKIQDTQVVFDVANRIIREMQEPFMHENLQLFSGTSIGIAFGDARYKTAQTMLRDADAAMYRAKEGGRGRYEIFNDSMHKAAMQHIQIEADLRRAIEEGELVPFYQPIVNMKRKIVVGLETLCRWEHPTKGLVMPGAFIGIAEDSGLITQIDMAVFKRAMFDLRSWQDGRRRRDHSIRVSVNMSSGNFMDPTFTDRVVEVLEVTGVNPKFVVFEMTESTLMEGEEIVLENMHRLKRLGISLSMDDFGTGYSSLSYLHKFPIDKLKIDQSFIRSLADDLSCERNQAIIKAIISMSKSLGLETISEGIENFDVFNMLNEMGCDFGQGYLISKPVSKAKIDGVIEHCSTNNFDLLNLDTIIKYQEVS